VQRYTVLKKQRGRLESKKYFELGPSRRDYCLMPVKKKESASKSGAKKHLSKGGLLEFSCIVAGGGVWDSNLRSGGGLDIRKKIRVTGTVTKI